MYITQENLTLIGNHPERFADVYGWAAANLRADLGPPFSTLSDDGCVLAFAAVVAFDLKPYGAAVGTDLKTLLALPMLDCDNYCALAVHLFRLARPLSPVKIYVVGWDRGAVGNHAQLFIENAGTPIVLDPTLALVAWGTFDYVAAGAPLAHIRELSQRAELAAFRAMVKTALAEGKYKPSDLLYYCDVDKGGLFSAPAGWPTPAVQRGNA